ncbi:sulfatase [Nonlabens sp. YIK11]|uniref:formylglycine-generating enzyme family protein n=1 Tax=Nonlabens sp. YIK11 TaxID=1453349 RepID=UPI000707C2D7|nr:formylglycine-generating enzyme family protein [Nonlabens sp. YIK11]KQC33354.1 sulfatase [Nonlabens sp. YIK11]
MTFNNYRSRKSLIKLVVIATLLFSVTACKKSAEVMNDAPDDATIVEVEKAPFEAPEGMVWVPGKTFTMGAKDSDAMAMPREKPSHEVRVDGFFMDATEVTNDEFSAFAKATQYKTVAERPIDWEQMKKELPEGTPKPADSILQPGSLVFNKDVEGVVDMNNYAQWWKWKIGANWRQPYGPGSSIEGKGDYPVVHIAYEDALAYCKWANRKLPTEAQWESAAQGTETQQIFTWGDDSSKIGQKSNTWEGQFPVNNTGADGFKYVAPVKSFDPNSLGLYDMAGNVWEWTSDLYNEDYYQTLPKDQVISNPQGANTYKNRQNPYQEEMVMKGGSYLCHASYCASYRISARMSTSRDSGSDHLGFRTVATPAMISAKN